MHILILPSWYPYSSRPISGVFFREQALALKNAGYKVGVVAPIQKSVREIIKKPAFSLSHNYWTNDCGVATIRSEHWAIPKCRRMNMYRWLSAGRSLLRDYLSEVGFPDLIHAHSLLYAGALAAEMKKIHGIPFVVTEHSTHYARGMIRGWQLPFIRAGVDHASVRIAVSEALADLLQKFHSDYQDKWVYVPNMVDVNVFCGTAPIASVGGPNKKFVFFSAALLTKKKGLNFLIDAFANNFASDHFELWIGGDGEERSALEAQAGSTSASARIRFLGKLDRAQMASYMAGCDIFVLPSLYETFGVVLIEALASGKPVIATRCGGPESIVTPNNGVLVSPSDPAALGLAMKEMVCNFNDFDSSAIRADCIAEFSNESVAAKLTEIYRHAIL